MSKNELTNKSVLNTLSLVYNYVLHVDKEGNVQNTTSLLPAGCDSVYLIISQVDSERMDNLICNTTNKAEEVFAFFNPNCSIKWAKITCHNIDSNIYLCIDDYTQEYLNKRNDQSVAKFDRLTHAHYRHDLDDVIEQIDTPENLPITFMMMDVNGMKLTNDAFGYSQGDALLKKCTTIINSAVSSDTYLFRMNGDEFLLICPRCDENSREKILRLINKMCKEETESMIPPSFSIGVAVKEKQNQRITPLILHAEQNLYANRIIESAKFKTSIIQNLKTHLSKKNYETSAHIARVKGLALTLGDELSLNQEQRNSLSIAAELHDIGKVSIPDEILSKQGPLTEEEWEIVKQHPVTSYRIIYGLGDMSQVAEIVLHHHERYDGNGYPSKLKGEDIPLLTRILTLVDSYDNMLNSPYVKNKMSIKDAITEIQECSGSQFDPFIAESLLNIIRKS